MAEKTLQIEVQEDHLERISQTKKPILAIAELVWNALDADASRVTISLPESGLGELEAIEVTDNGHSIAYSEIDGLFTKLGGSWKQRQRKTKELGRLLHGKEGRGRFRAFALGRVVDWYLCYQKDGGLRTYRVEMIRDHLRNVRIGDDEDAAAGAQRGTTVRIGELIKDFHSLRDPSAPGEMSLIFALYLRQYRDVEVFYLGTKVDPAATEDHCEILTLSPIKLVDEEKEFSVNLEIVEWSIEAPRKLYFCTEDGFPLDDDAPGVQAPGFNFTAYLKSEYFSHLAAQNAADLARLDPLVAKALDEAKREMRAYFRRRSSEKARGLVKEWQEEEVYPYQGEPLNEIETAERQVFNVVALNVSSYLPDFEEADPKTKRLQFRLLRHALERGPADLAIILDEVLGLPLEKRQELIDLLKRTTLSAIISASAIIADRLEFLRGLETLIFDTDFKERTLERSQLHRLVAENTWIFGEQYGLSADDQSLTEVLKKHIELQGLEIEIDEPVKRLDGSLGIVDLMLSKAIPTVGDGEREHLVVELKRPSVKIDKPVTEQVESYAFAVAADERFRDVKTRWVFWALSTDIDDHVRRLASQTNRPRGVLYQDEEQNITIWVKSWSQIIDDCKRRLQFFQDKLNYQPDRDSSLAHLRKTYAKYLSELFASDEAKSDDSDNR
jgi:hypothetical protein